MQHQNPSDQAKKRSEIGALHRIKTLGYICSAYPQGMTV